MKARIRMQALGTLCSLLFTPWIAAHAGSGAFQFDFGYQTAYESNIYHSYEGRFETGANLNLLAATVAWKPAPTRHFYQRAYLAMDLDLYTSYGNRNRSSFELRYSPLFRYARWGRLSFDGQVSRRNKDLIDDSGQILPRTLKKWDYDLEIGNRLDIGRLRLEQAFAYGNTNYDEEDTLAIVGADTTLVPLMSYDYHDFRGLFSAEFEILSRLTSRLAFGTEKRNYDERRTYTVQYGATRGRPFEIRSYTENAIGLGLDFLVVNRNSISLETEFTRRKDNFENFYGFDQWQHRIAIDLNLHPRHSTEISFRFKTKDYDNYWNRNIGVSNRVSIDYADFQVEHRYQLTGSTTISAYVRNYNKVSNDPSFDYHDVTVGTGFAVRY